VGTVAALRPEKNFARLLRAFARVRRERPCQLIVVGDGAERPSLESLAQDLGISGSVRFAGHIDDPVPYYRSFDVFVLTSDTEQMPYTVLEAMAAGLPVVSTDVGDIRAMVSEENGLLVVQPHDGQIAEAITLAVTNQAMSRRIGDANRRRVQERYAQPTMFDAFAKLYRSASVGQSEP
jgi:glycosyltransferase involved in cell wall biosynthesis